MTEFQSAREWLIKALDHVPKPLFFLDLDAKKVWFSNKAAQELLGFRYEVGWAYDEAFKQLKLFNADGSDLAIENYPSRRSLRGDRIDGEEFIAETPTGRHVLRVFVDQMPSFDGQPRTAVILLQDITALRQSERELRKAQSDLQSAVDVAQIGFWSVDIESGELTVTPLFLKQFGQSEEEFEGTLEGGLQRIVAEDREKVRVAVDRAMFHNESYHIEYRVQHDDSEMRWIEAKGGTVRDKYGKPIRLTGTTVDISERKQAEQKLAVERSLLDQIFVESPAAMTSWTGQDLVFGRVNPEYQKIFPGRQLEGLPLLEAVPELRGQGFAELLLEVMESGKPHHGEEVAAMIRDLDGTLKQRFYDYSYIPLKDHDGVAYGVYDHAVDVTDAVLARRELETARLTAEAANQTKSQFLANMSHEIRTPLGAIMGFASLLKDPDIGRDQLEGFVDVIERNSNQLLRIIDDILDLSKVEAGMLAVEHIDFSLPELITDFSSLMGLKAREKGIGFNSRAVTPLPKIVNSDPTRLRQILMNVVGNALKFTERGSVEIRVQFHQGRLIFEVEDSGRGISDDEATQLFRPFSQADSSITRKYGGTGLGLVLTRNLAQALGGTFELVRSEIGKGSVFRVEVAVEADPDSEFVTGLGFQTVPPKSVAATGELAHMKVLLVEDSPDNQALISIYLGRAGAQTDIASDGAQGVQMALLKDYDVVLMDVQMPVMDGLTAVRSLRAKGYQRPIIALTAHAMREERARCLEAGFNEFLSKPVARKDLIAILVPHRREFS